jgi:taurine dioxygenase
MMTVRKVTGSLGALVEGVRLNELDDNQFDAVHQALLEHQVLFFRGQHLSDDEHLALAERWGEPMAHPVARLTGDAHVLASVEDTADRPPTADQWHTDITYWPEPPKVAVLCALTLPPAGGDTLWSDLYGAYDALSAPLQQLCHTLRALHGMSPHFIRSWQKRHGDDSGAVIAEHMAGAVLPVVRTHDETGRQALFYSSNMEVLDVHRAEHEFLVRHFHDLVSDPNRCVRWRWSVGDVAIWDERCTNHRALSDHYPHYRLMRRCTVQGGRPFFRSLGAETPQFIATSA